MTHQPEERLEEIAAEVAWVRRLAIAVASDAHTGEDIAQEALLAASAADTPAGGSWKSWLAGAVRKLHLRRGRSDADRRARERQAARPDLVEDPSFALERLEVQEALSQAVRALEEPYRSTVLLRWFEGLEPEQIARRTGVPVRTVHTRVTRALSMLREMLDRRSRGDRTRWLAAWLPLLPGSSNAMKATIMGIQAKFVAAGVCAIALVSLWLAHPWRPQPPEQQRVPALALSPNQQAASEAPRPVALDSGRHSVTTPPASAPARTKRRLSEILTEIWRLPEDQSITTLLDHEAGSAVPEAILKELAHTPLESREAQQLLRMLREDAPSLAGHEATLVHLASSPRAESFRESAVRVLLVQNTDTGRQAALDLTSIAISNYEGPPGIGLLSGASRQLVHLAEEHVPGTTDLARQLLALAGSPPRISFPEDGRREGQVLPEAEQTRRWLLREAYRTCAQMGDERGLAVLQNAIASTTTPTEQSIVWEPIESALDSGSATQGLSDAFQPEFVRILSGKVADQNRSALRAAILWAGTEAGRGDLLLGLEPQIESTELDVQGRWTRAIAEIGLRTHDPACLAALTRQAARPEFLSRQYESHNGTWAAAVKALVVHGTDADFDLLAKYATAGNDPIAKLLLENATTEQLSARPTLIDGILSKLDTTLSGSPSLARALALQRLHEMRPSADVLAKYASSDDYYRRLDADRALSRGQYGATTESERSAKLLDLLQLIDAGEKITSLNATRALHDWISGRMVAPAALAAAMRSPSLTPGTRVQLLFEVLAARDVWTTDEVAAAVQAAGESLCGTRLERKFWALVVAYLTRDPKSWAWALDLVQARVARSPSVEEALREPLDELAVALAPEAR